MAAREKVAVPAQYRVRTHQQPRSAEHVPWQQVQQCRQECPIARSGPRPLLAELAFQHRDLVAQGQYLDVLSRSPIGSRRSMANAFATPRQASRSSCRGERHRRQSAPRATAADLP
jgi:hypothetical protein